MRKIIAALETSMDGFIKMPRVIVSKTLKEVLSSSKTVGRAP
jgi:hypothetical protein